MHWYLEVLRKYAEFGGRARRKEYWMYTLISVLISVILAVVDVVSGLNEATNGLNPISMVYALAVIIPGLAVFVRRLHDIDKSGWWFFIVLIPLVGGLILLLFLVRPGDSGANEYGDDPKSLRKKPSSYAEETW